MTGAGHPEIGVTPILYNFGKTKEGYSSKSLVCTISNTGDTDLNISGMVLSDSKNFTLRVNRGPNPCGSTTPILVPGSNGTFTVTFTPASDGLKSTILKINSDDPDNSLVILSFNGEAMPVYSFNTWSVFQRNNLGYRPTYSYPNILNIPDFSKVWNMPNFSRIMGMQNLYTPFNYSFNYSNLFNSLLQKKSFFTRPPQWQPFKNTYKNNFYNGRRYR